MGKKKEQRGWETKSFESVWYLQVLLTFWWLLSIFKSTRFHSHCLLSQAIVDITILQHCFLYFLMLSNCFHTLVSFVYLFCRTWVILREFFMIAAKFCPKMDLLQIYFISEVAYHFFISTISSSLEDLLWTKFSWVFLHPLKEKK